ncbi:MAG: VCBS repeat-containing protein, partial [Myxococcota bacterium]
MTRLPALLLVLVSCGDSDPMDRPDVVVDDASIDGRLLDAPVIDAASAESGMLDGDATVSPSVLRFVDRTAAASLGFEREPADGYDTLMDRMSGGVCPIDADGAPPLDLFFAFRPSGTTRSFLFVADKAFEYRNETDRRGLGAVGDAIGCLAFDEDGDGDQDLVVSGLGTLQLFHNEGGTFVDRSDRFSAVTLDPRGMYTSLAAGDLDGDGVLELAVAGFIRFEPELFRPGQRCGEVLCLGDLASFSAIRNLLLVRDAGGFYVDVAEVRAPEFAESEATLVLSIGNLDGVPGPELYVGNDLGWAYRDRLLKPGPGGLADIAEARGLAYNRRGYGIDTMGFATGDIDNDGDLDHAGTSFERDGTALFVCGPDFCQDRARERGLERLSNTFRWGIAFFDADRDGDLDLLEATGHIYPDPEAEALGFESR